MSIQRSVLEISVADEFLDESGTDFNQTRILQSVFYDNYVIRIWPADSNQTRR